MMLNWDYAEDLIDVAEAVSNAARGIGALSVVVGTPLPLVLGHPGALHADLRRRLRRLDLGGTHLIALSASPAQDAPTFLDVCLTAGNQTEHLALPMAGSIALT
jgi:hypothetical protein